MSDVSPHLPTADLARALAARRVSSRELLETYLSRIEALGGGINAVVTIDADGARRRADAADAALARGESWGPLHGVPLTLKDTFEVAGMRTTAGAPDLGAHVPGRDSIVAERLRTAGAVLFGKTNVPIMAGDLQSYNAIFGTTNNPWNGAHAPGGSSGGAAAALAAGLTGGDYGSDIGGSIRTPASWCGIYGLKPSWGLVPLRGHIPGPPGTLSEVDLGVAGPLGRSAEDLDLLLDVTAGPLADRARAWRLDLPPPRRQRLGDYRVAAWLDHPAAGVDSQVSVVLRAAVDAVARAGVSVQEGAPLGIELADVVRCYLRLVYPVILSGFPPAVFEQMRELAQTLPADDDSALARVARYGTATHRDWLSAHESREHCRARMAAFFEDVDVLLCPVVPTAAIPHDHSEPQVGRTILVNGRETPYFEQFNWIALATMAYLPAAVAPVGRTAAGLPVGMQIIAPHLEDRTAIDFARRLGEVVGGYETPPGF